ncbi:Uncharacterised protein [BD1-7 clade bacterium]|uniref:DMT family transporter n=1 Tax=BD1-7 clade bacterium TaxID=2029982 RepID=A0A5S9PKP8_9GAMM|nr:Uncharacterised protein [BD1-7 clade bacterium]CAA0104601.1 Uncharacterised protein [BD1-7 clade bacterium]
MNILPLLAIAAGVAISLQATLNARLGVLIDSALLSTGFAFSVGAIICWVIAIASGQLASSADQLTHAPLYLYVSGGFLGALGVGMLYFLIPKIGIGPMTVFSLGGQLFVATIASHFGWFDLPQSSVTPIKLIGIATLIVGVVLTNSEVLYAH